MNSRDLLRMSITNLLRRKTRTVLTVLGVVIGTASIVVMLSLGLAMDKSFHEDLARMGSLNTIDVYYGGMRGPEMSTGPDAMVELNDQAVTRIEAIPGVQAVMPIKRAYMKFGAGKMVADMPVMGIKPGVLEAFDLEAEQGRLLLSSDKNAVLFGSEVAYNFYNPRLRGGGHYGMGPRGPDSKPPVDLVSSKLILTSDMNYGERRRETRDSDYKPPRPHEVKGVGVLKQSQNEWDFTAFMNMAELERILEEDERNSRDNRDMRRQPRNQGQYESLKVRVVNMDQVQAVQEQIKEMGFEAFSLTDMLESMKKASRTVQAVLGGIGAVSLLVAAIGITNTMTMSIYERTREIGIFKVLGANISDIARLFLLEAGMIGFTGGGFGIALSYLASWGLNKLAPHLAGGMGPTSQISYIPVTLVILALGFSTLVGIVSGFMPARRAMKLSALDAIRSDF